MRLIFMRMGAVGKVEAVGSATGAVSGLGRGPAGEGRPETLAQRK